MIAVAGVAVSGLPLPRVDLDARACLGPRDIPASMWLFVLGAAVVSVAMAGSLARWGIPHVVRGRAGIVLGLVVVLAMAAATWNALWIATLPYDCGAPIPVLDPLLALLPTVIATALSVAGRHRFPSVIASGLLVAAPIVLVLSLGWALYRPAAATASLVVSGVCVLLGLSPALGALRPARRGSRRPNASQPR